MRPPRKAGFTLVELLLVLFVIALLASLVAPVATRSVIRSREATLKQDLHVMRKAIDDYYSDNGVYPDSLELLVEKHYLHKIPVDPITDRASSWVADRGLDGDGGVTDIHSGAEGTASDGKAYSEW